MKRSILCRVFFFSAWEIFCKLFFRIICLRCNSLYIQHLELMINWMTGKFMPNGGNRIEHCSDRCYSAVKLLMEVLVRFWVCVNFMWDILLRGWVSNKVRFLFFFWEYTFPRVSCTFFYTITSDEGLMEWSVAKERWIIKIVFFLTLRGTNFHNIV